MADRELYGFLYPKEKREGKQPHMTGTILIEGKLWELAGWSKVSAKGAKYLSLKAQEAGGENPANDSDSDELPF